MSRLVPLLLVQGCIFVIKEPVCTDLAAVSVTVTVEDDAGVAVEGATVTWRRGDDLPVDCEPWGPDENVFACGFEEAGELSIQVEAPGYEPFSQVVRVQADECHVVGQAVTAVLTPLECTEEVRPSVEVTVEGSSGEALTGVDVTWYLAPDGATAPCTEVGEVWWCGEEQAGEVVVTAVADGHTEASATVTVEADTCHVLTEALTLQLDWLPD